MTDQQAKASPTFYEPCGSARPVHHWEHLVHWASLGRFARRDVPEAAVPLFHGQVRFTSLQHAASQEVKLGSHSRIVRSLLALARSLPSRLNATPFTDSLWPVRGWPCGRPEATSHSCAVSSPLALASSVLLAPEPEPFARRRRR